jgi:hypothetical protein
MDRPADAVINWRNRIKRIWRINLIELDIADSMKDDFDLAIKKLEIIENADDISKYFLL